MSTSKKQVKSLHRSQPDMLDMIDQANMDADFIKSFLDLLCAAGEGKQLETVPNRSIVCLCSESKARIDSIKIFIRNILAYHDSNGKTAGNDRISEEIAGYGRNDEGDANWLFQKPMLFLTMPGLQAHD